MFPQLFLKKIFKSSIVINFVILLFFLPLTSVKAEESSSSLTLGSLTKEALANNRELQAAREQLQAVKHRVPQSSALPDPTVGYAIMGPDLETPLGPQRDIYEFEQMIPFPGKLLEKRKMARAEVDATQAQLKAVERDVILKVSEAYYDLYAVEVTLQVTEEIQDLLKKFEAVAQARYSSQKGEQRDVAKAQAEVSDTIQRVFILRQQKQTLVALLNALLNRNSNTQFDKITQPELPKSALSLDQLLDEARQNRPELLEAKAMLKKDQHANSLAKYEYAPDISVGFQYTRIGVGNSTDPDAGRDAWMIPLKFTVPLWQNRIVPAVQEARRTLNSSEAKLGQMENLTEYEIKSAYYRFTTAKQTVELYENALIPEAELAFRSDQAGYEAGRTDILNLIDSERVYLNARIAYYQALSEALKSYAAIERTVGMDLSNKGENQ